MRASGNGARDARARDSENVIERKNWRGRRAGVLTAWPGGSRPIPEKFRYFKELSETGGGKSGRATGAGHRRRKEDIDNFTRDSDSYRAQTGRRSVGPALPGKPRKRLIFHAYRTPQEPSGPRGSAPPPDIPDIVHLGRSSAASPRLDRGASAEDALRNQVGTGSACIQLHFPMAPVGDAYRRSPPRRGPEPAFSLLRLSSIANLDPHG